MPDWLYYIYVKARRESQIVLENMKLGLVSIVTSGLRFFFSAELCWRMRNGMWSFKSSLTRWFCLNTLGFWQSLPSAYLEIFAGKISFAPRCWDISTMMECFAPSRRCNAAVIFAAHVMQMELELCRRALIPLGKVRQRFFTSSISKSSDDKRHFNYFPSRFFFSFPSSLGEDQI